MEEVSATDTARAAERPATWRIIGRRYLPVVLVILLGASASIVGFVGVSAWEHERVRTYFERRAATRALAVERSIGVSVELLQDLGSFLAVMAPIDRRQFRQAVERRLAAHPSTRALEWVPRIPAAERAGMERAAVADGYRDFRITERSPQGSLVSAGPRNEYFPVFFVEPLKGNEVALGFDLGSDPARLKALQRARDTGRPIATAPIRLVQEKGDQYGFLIFVPVYSPGAAVETIEERRRHLMGFALGVFRAGDMIDAALQGLGLSDVSVAVYDLAAPEADRHVYALGHDGRGLPPASGGGADSIDAGRLRSARSIEVANRQWSMVFTSTPAYRGVRSRWEPWVTPAAGLLLTLILAAYIQTVIRRGVLLVQTKGSLEREIAGRVRAQGATTALAELGRELVSTLDTGEASQQIVSSVLRLFGGRRAALFIADPASDGLTCVAAAGSGDSGKWIGQRLPAGAGLAGRAVAEGRLVVSVDYQDQRALAIPDWALAVVREERLRSAAAVPLITQGCTVGALFVAGDSKEAFVSADLSLLTVFADYGAIALRNAQLFAETERRREAAECLADLARMTSRSLDPEEVSRQITESVRQRLNTASVVYRLDESSGDLVVLAVSGLKNPIARGVRIPRGMGAVGCAVRDRQRVVTDDFLSDPRFVFPPDVRAAIEREEYQAVLALPLITGERIVGALAIFRHIGWTFDEEQVRLAELLAAQAALALDNARLHKETQGRLKDTEALLAVTQAAGRTAEPAEALRGTTKLLVQALGADTGGLLYFDTVGDRVVPLAGYRVPKELLDLLSGDVPLSHPFFETIRTLDHPLCARDSQSDPRLSEDPWTRSFTHKSILLLPVEIKNQVRGVFTLAWIRDAHCFSIDELRLAEGVAQQAGLAIENLELLEGLQGRQRRLEALLEATRQLSSIQPLETLLQKIAEACGQMLGATGVGFRLVEGDELVVAARWGGATELMPTLRLKAGQSLVGRVAASGEPLVVRDLGNDPRVLASHRELVCRLGYHGWLGVPVKLGEQLLGVLSVYTRGRGGFSADDLAAASAFAAQASTALENARLYQEVQHAYDQLSRTQEQLIQAQKMEAVGRLAGGVAHDFNNLLTIITGRTLLLRKQLDGATELDRHAALIEKTAQRAAGLTAQLLAFSRKQMLQPKVLDLNGLVGNVGTLLRRLIGEDIDFLTVLGPGLAPVKADPGQLEQVLMNLVVNARDAMPGRGRVTIETANVVLDPTYASRHADVQTGPYVLLAVSDTGVGMDPATKAHMFEPFFTTKAQGKGTGLGLATVYGIVKQSGGHIAVYSEPGQGTTFKIYLPAVDQPIDAREDRGVSSPPRGSETLLLVEDEGELRDLLAEVLETSGYTVLKAQDCEDAIKLCAEREGSIDLLLTDVVMPKMSGRELADRLQKARPTLKVLYMSGYTDGAIVYHGVLEAGVSFLQKPFTPVTVGQKVREVLDGHQHAAGVLSAS